MKYILYSTLIFLLAIGFSSCEIHDPVDDLASIGNKKSMVYYECSSSATAGSSVNFEANYFPTENSQVESLEIWYNISREVNQSLSCPLLSTKYTQADKQEEIVRTFEKIASYTHSDNFWDSQRRTYVLKSAFPTSNTLQAISWANVETFDEKKFKSYFSTEFIEDFKKNVFDKATIEDMKNILTKYNPRLTVSDFVNHTDSTFNENSGSYDVFIKETSKPILKELFNSIPVDSLTFNRAEYTFEVNYSKVFTLSTKFKLKDSRNIEVFSRAVDVTLN